MFPSTHREMPGKWLGSASGNVTGGSKKLLGITIYIPGQHVMTLAMCFRGAKIYIRGKCLCDRIDLRGRFPTAMHLVFGASGQQVGRFPAVPHFCRSSCTSPEGIGTPGQAFLSRRKIKSPGGSVQGCKDVMCTSRQRDILVLLCGNYHIM